MALITWGDKGSNVTLSNQNLTANISGLHAVRATEGKSSGKWYWELAMNPNPAVFLGIDDGTETLTHHGETSGNNRIRGYGYNGDKSGTTRTSYGGTIIETDVISVLLDLDSGTIEFWKSGVSQGIAFTDLKNMKMPVYPRVSSWSESGANRVVTANFGATPFKYTMPTGFQPYDLNSSKSWNSLSKILLLSGHKTYSLRKNEKKYEAKMTSNTAPTPFVASASSENGVYLAWKAFNGSLTTSEDAWATLTNVTNAYLQIDFGKQISIDGFAVGSRYYAVSSLHQYAPKDFNLLASNDGVVFDKVAEITGQSDWGSAEIRKFIAYTGKKYRYYRLQVLSVNGGNLINVGSLEFFSSEITQIPIANEQNFINHGFDTLEGLKRVYSVKNYILQDGVSENEDGLWVQELNRKPLSIKFE